MKKEARASPMLDAHDVSTKVAGTARPADGPSAGSGNLEAEIGIC